MRPMNGGAAGLGGEPSGPTAVSVRQGRDWGPVLAVLGLTVLALATFGFRLLSPAYPGGDLLFHGALALGLVREGLPLESAYSGLPAYYPPVYHLLLGGIMTVTGGSPLDAANVLFLLLLPVLPAATYLLARDLTGRPWVAVLAVALTLFAGAYNLNPLRQWVNSLFIGGHMAWSAYPRDLAFAAIALAAVAWLRTLRTTRPLEAISWGAAAGLLLGLGALVQVQILLPVPFAFGAASLAVAIRDRDRRAPALLALATGGVLALALAAPWFVGTVQDVRASGGLVLDSSDMLEAARFGPWSYPREFGLLLPLGVLGAGVMLLFLRRPDGPRPGGAPGPWHPRPPEGGLLLVVLWALPFALGVLYDPGWPLEDALRPQRLWLIASQPLAILAAVGLVVAAEHILGARPIRGSRRPRLVIAAVLAVAFVASLPATLATATLVARTWTSDRYAMLDRDLDGVPHFDELLGRNGPRETILAPEDWSALLWFDTGHQVVGLVPPGYAKLAFDPAVFSGTSQEVRRAALVEAWSGSPEQLTAVADRFEARRIVVPADGDHWALVDLAAAEVALADPQAAPGTDVVEGNGWDAVRLDPGERLALPTVATGTVGVRVKTLPVGPGPDRLRAWGASRTDGTLRDLALIETSAGGDGWARGSADIRLAEGEHLVLEAVGAPVVVQSVQGWVPRPPVPAGWRLADSTPGDAPAQAAVLERTP